MRELERWVAGALNQSRDPPDETKSYNCLWPSTNPGDYPFINSELMLILTYFQPMPKY